MCFLALIELMPDVSVLDDVVLEGIPVRLWLKELNRRICENIGQDARNLQIGHSYLMPSGKTVSKFSLFAKIVQNDIIPLLEEYCYENYDVLQRLLGSSIVDVSSWRIRHEIFESQDQAVLASALLSSCPDIAASISAIEGTEEHSVEEAEEMDDEE
jgi:5-methylcytosine-specific restriction enzyme B